MRKIFACSLVIWWFNSANHFLCFCWLAEAGVNRDCNFASASGKVRLELRSGTRAMISNDHAIDTFDMFVCVCVSCRVWSIGSRSKNRANPITSWTCVLCIYFFSDTCRYDSKIQIDLQIMNFSYRAVKWMMSSGAQIKQRHCLRPSWINLLFVVVVWCCWVYSHGVNGVNMCALWVNMFFFVGRGWARGIFKHMNFCVVVEVIDNRKWALICWYHWIRLRRQQFIIFFFLVFADIECYGGMA